MQSTLPLHVVFLITEALDNPLEVARERIVKIVEERYYA